MYTYRFIDSEFITSRSILQPLVESSVFKMALNVTQKSTK